MRMAQAAANDVIPFFFVDGGSPYPKPSDFFPGAGTGGNFNLSTILQPFEALKNDMVVLDGVDMNSKSGNIKGNWHVGSVGRVLTAKKPNRIGNTLDGLPGGPSIDQIIAQTLGRKSVEVLVNDKAYNHMRARPFAIGENKFKLPNLSASQTFDNLFRDCQSGGLNDENAKEERLNRLRAEKSILDSLTGELSRLRRELVGVEKIKLDSHESSIREAERSVARELKVIQNNANENQDNINCNPDIEISDRNVPMRSKAHFDVLFAAIQARRAGVYGMMHGFSSTKWNYEWLNLQNLNTNVHDGVFHRAGSQRENFLAIARWKWGELAKFAERLKNEPGGSLLDNVLIYATSHFGSHHRVERIPLVLIGNAQGKLTTGRVLKVNTLHDKVMTSVAHLCGASISGIGDFPNCGPLAEL